MLVHDHNPALLMTPEQAAAVFGLKPTTLKAWRLKGGGPKFVRITSRCIRYRIGDLEAFAAARVHTSTSAATVHEEKGQ